jgi:hypothetical protein
LLFLLAGNEGGRQKQGEDGYRSHLSNRRKNVAKVHPADDDLSAGTPAAEHAAVF